MSKKVVLWVFVGIAVLIAGLLSGFVLLQPSAEDILITTLESVDSIQDGHVVFTIDSDTIEKSLSGTIEVWGQRVGDKKGAFRLEVLDASDAELDGVTLVSDGETLWAYSPQKNQVLLGTLEEARAMMAEKKLNGFDFMDGKFSEKDLQEAETNHPKNAEDAVQKLSEYFKISKSGSDTLAGTSVQTIKLDPIPEQMPSEYTALGGYIELWIDPDRNVPLGAAFTGSSIGDISVETLELELNQGVDASLFKFDIPAGVEILSFADLEPRSLSLEEASNNAEFNLLTPDVSLVGGTLVDVINVRGAIVQRFALQDGGSFSLIEAPTSEDQMDSFSVPSVEKQSVDLRGVSGTLFSSNSGDQVLLTWTEGDLIVTISGDLTQEQALAVAESLK